jgi:hypothetical protein
MMPEEGKIHLRVADEHITEAAIAQYGPDLPLVDRCHSLGKNRGRSERILCVEHVGAQNPFARGDPGNRHNKEKSDKAAGASKT